MTERCRVLERSLGGYEQGIVGAERGEEPAQPISSFDLSESEADLVTATRRDAPRWTSLPAG